MEQPEESAATEMGEIVDVNKIEEVNVNKQSDCQWIQVVAGSHGMKVIEVLLLKSAKRLLNSKKGLGPESVANSQNELQVVHCQWHAN